MQIDLHVNLEKLEHERHQAENSPPCVSTVAYSTSMFTVKTFKL